MGLVVNHYSSCQSVLPFYLSDTEKYMPIWIPTGHLHVQAVINQSTTKVQIFTASKGSAFSFRYIRICDKCIFLVLWLLPDLLYAAGKYQHVMLTGWEWFCQFLFSIPWKSSGRDSSISHPGIRWSSYRVLWSFKKYDRILFKLLISTATRHDLDAKIFVLILSWTPSSCCKGSQASCWRESFCSSRGCWMET